MTMPILPLDLLVTELTDSEERIVRAAFTGRGVKDKDNGRAKLRANKPFKRATTFEQGCTNYVWRMLCFDLVGSGKHACMPVCADFDLYDAIDILHGPDDRDSRRQHVRVLMAEMDDLTKRFEAKLPKELMKGVIRWGRALGYLN